jgi:hypothetical protein
VAKCQRIRNDRPLGGRGELLALSDANLLGERPKTEALSRHSQRLPSAGREAWGRYCSQGFAFMLAPSPHSSGRGFGPRRSGGTLQLSTRCSSLALPPSRSLAVRIGWTWLASPFARGVTAGAANAASRMSVHATRWARARNIRGELAIGSLSI